MDVGELLIVMFTGAVAASTVAYAVLTWRLVSETRKMRQLQTEPRVSVRVELAEPVGHGGLELVIRNEGQGPAQNIRFSFEGDPTYFVGHGHREPIDQIPIIKNGLPYLGPGQNFRFLLGWLFGEAFDRAKQEPWTFHIDYKSLVGKPKRDTYILDFSQFLGFPIGTESPLVKMEKHLETLKNDVHHMTTGFSELHAVVQTKEDSRKKREDLLKERRDMSSDSGTEPNGTG